MKKITGILLAFTFVLYLGGIQIAYWLKMSAHKRETQTAIQSHKLPENNTVKFSLTSLEYASLAWSERSKEFSYLGQRYDIIGIQYYSDEIIITCYSDKEETRLVNAFTGFVKKFFSSPQHTNDKTPSMASNLCKEYLPSEPLTSFLYAGVLISIKAKCAFVNMHPKPDDIWHPPTI